MTASGVGLFGGTFDPIHLGHLRAAEELREAYGLTELRFVPAANPPHKPAGALTPAADRLAMIERAIADTAGFRVWTVELERPGPSYSVDTIRTLRDEMGPRRRIVFAIGRDAFADFHTWRDHLAIFALCDLAVLTRPPWPPTLALDDFPVAAREAFWYDPGSDEFVHASGHRVRLHRITGLDISATDIRGRTARGASIRFLVPRDVERYIVTHGLYRAGARA